MKKLSIIFLVFLISCGNTSEESSNDSNQTDTTTKDIETTTTTIPSVPTSDINFIEIFESKLGSELCKDAKEVTTTTEVCLKQYIENLTYLVSLQDDISNYAKILIDYKEQYPESNSEVIEKFISFVENDYSQIFIPLEEVQQIYKSRFGGVPVINNLTINNELWNECPADIEIEGTENIKSGLLIYENKIGEKIEIPLSGSNNYFDRKLNVMGGEFTLTSAKLTNFLNEEFEGIATPVNSFYVNHWDAFFSKVEILNYDNSQITVSVEWIDGYLKMEAFSLLFQREGLYEGNMNVAALTKFGSEKAKSLNKESYFDNGGYSLTYIEKSDNKTVVSYNFKQQQAIELTEQPFRLNRIMSTDPWYEKHELVYFYRFNDARTDVVAIEFTRKVGCNGEGSVQNKQEYFELNDFAFTLPFNSYESYFVTKP